ncbi:MAG TPA: monofunctional biosynthetic peptidoglycan transglycosylase [Burkholderiales bacterium]|nr:monofunctional biosynthetic peptidoglycan transglycosylase [Burkholderiales bacterium]
MKRRLRRWLGRALVLGIGLVLLYELWIFSHVLWWNWFNPSTSAFMEERLEVLQERNPEAKLRHQWVTYDKISLNLKRALVAAEDANFMEHEGFDWDAIQKAYEKNLKKGKIVAGGSTISQQLAKNLFLSGRRTPLRKVQEAIITVMIETVMSKQRIFEIYLNSIEWGNAVFGAEAAARYYFNRSASNLDAWEAARLAAMVPKPRYYDRNRDTPWLDTKTNLILQRMPAAQVP